MAGFGPKSCHPASAKGYSAHLTRSDPGLDTVFPVYRTFLKPVTAIALFAGFAPNSSGASGTGVLVQEASEKLQGEVAGLAKRAASRAAKTRREAWRLLSELELSGEVAGKLAEQLKPTANEQLQDLAKVLRRGATLFELEELGHRRVELDLKRSSALALIFNEELYFYPHDAASVGVDQARLYPPVQDEVASRVAAVRLLWEDQALIVRLPASFRVAAADLALLTEVAARLQIDLAWPGELPSWVVHIAEADEPLTLQNFSWTPEQRLAMAYDRSVREHNEDFWSSCDEAGASGGEEEFGFPRGIEREQVRITNAYRRMLGRPALIWNPKLQHAVRQHCEFMADSNSLTHTQPYPRSRTHAVRMRRAGYRGGTDENLFFGAGGAPAAHYWWVRSSGHHRNLLKASSRAMASAEVRGYWTQNFGTHSDLQIDRPAQDHGNTDR